MRMRAASQRPGRGGDGMNDECPCRVGDLNLQGKSQCFLLLNFEFTIASNFELEQNDTYLMPCKLTLR